jgi:hypothetical protein
VENGDCSHRCTRSNCMVAARPRNLAIPYAICCMNKGLIPNSAARHLIRAQRLETHRGMLRTNYPQVQLPPTYDRERRCVESRATFRKSIIAPEKSPKDTDRGRDRCPKSRKEGRAPRRRPNADARTTKTWPQSSIVNSCVEFVHQTLVFPTSHAKLVGIDHIR